MVVEHKIANQKVDVKNDYSSDFHDSWFDYQEFQELLESEYMSNLMHYINQYYDKFNVLFPSKGDIFKSFKNINFQDIRVVIFNEAPPKSYKASGNGFGEFSYKNQDISEVNITLKDIEKRITSTYPETSNFKFDRTLNLWNEQGVLVINESLIASTSASDELNIERLRIFRHFVRTMVKLIDEYLTEVIFVFTDDSQKEIFGKYININYNYVLTTDGINADTTIFDDINQLLIENAKDITDWDEVVISW